MDHIDLMRRQTKSLILFFVQVLTFPRTNERVFVQDIVCTHLGLENIVNPFHESNQKLNFNQLHFYLEKTDGAVEKADEVSVKVFETSDVRRIYKDLIAPIIQEFLHDQFVVHNSILKLDTENLKIKEVLKLEKNISVFLRVQLKNFPTTGMLICRDITKISLSYVKTCSLPRHKELHPSHSLSTFNKLTDIISRNSRKDPGNRLQCSILLCGEDGSGKIGFCTCLAENLGLNYIESSGRDLVGDTPALTEINIAKAVIEVNSCMPSVWVIRDVNCLVSTREGLLDERILFSLETGFSTLSPSTVVVGTCHSKEKMFPKLSRFFLHVQDLRAPDAVDRTAVVRRIVEDRDIDLEDDQLSQYVSGVTVGFNIGDLNALMDAAVMFCCMDGRNRINKVDFIHGLETLKKSRSKSLGLAEVPSVRWEDVGGLHDVKRELLQAVSSCGSGAWKRSGILLYGPPGVGKTLLAKAVATECSMSFISVKGPELLNMYVGQSEENVRDIFKRAHEAEPCIVFFDELDSLAPSRGQSGDSGGVMDRVVSALLSELDGLERMKVIVIGATNRPDLLDSALLRPGRFDKSLFIGTSSDPYELLDILSALTRKMRLASDCELARIVSCLSPGLSGADLSGLVSGAALRAVQRIIQTDMTDQSLFSDEVSMQDFLEVAQTLEPSVKNK